MDTYCEKLRISNPKYILGLGIYSGRDKRYIWNEQFCNYNGNSIKITPFIPETEIIKNNNHIGKGYCNLISVKIMTMIERGDITSKFSFLHIPKNFNLESASTEIDTILFDIIKHERS